MLVAVAVSGAGAGVVTASGRQTTKNSTIMRCLSFFVYVYDDTYNTTHAVTAPHRAPPHPLTVKACLHDVLLHVCAYI